jgi:hypothetical protein
MTVHKIEVKHTRLHLFPDFELRVSVLQFGSAHATVVKNEG